ncbi:hypothetical protein QJS66_03145 [Kocuria rhizophila]|nr:hypothetical protein QJS66_03145 [Kocuria rhizophila]
MADPVTGAPAREERGVAPRLRGGGRAAAGPLLRRRGDASAGVAVLVTPPATVGHMPATRSRLPTQATRASSVPTAEDEEDALPGRVEAQPPVRRAGGVCSPGAHHTRKAACREDHRRCAGRDRAVPSVRQSRPLSAQEPQLDGPWTGRAARADPCGRRVPLGPLRGGHATGPAHATAPATRPRASWNRWARASRTWPPGPGATTASRRAASSASSATDGKLPLHPGRQDRRRAGLLPARPAAGQDGQDVHHHVGVSGFSSHAVVTASRSCPCGGRRPPSPPWWAAPCSPEAERAQRGAPGTGDSRHGRRAWEAWASPRCSPRCRWRRVP